MTEQEKQNLRRQIERLYGRIARLEAERDALKMQLAEAQAEIAELKAAVEFVEDAFGTL